MPTIGVAIEVPEPYGSQLRNHRAEFGDQLAQTVPSHVTLLPPTEFDDDELDRVGSYLTEVAGQHEPFTMRLRGTGTFRPISPVVFVTVTAGISQTEQLAASVRKGLLRGQLDYPYHPHVTVAQRLDDAALDVAFETLHDFECTFDVAGFALYMHDDVAGWRTARIFDLD